LLACGREALDHLWLRRELDDEAKRVPSIPVPDLVARTVAPFDPIVRGQSA
jgi:hypothetical protein